MSYFQKLIEGSFGRADPTPAPSVGAGGSSSGNTRIDTNIYSSAFNPRNMDFQALVDEHGPGVLAPMFNREGAALGGLDHLYQMAADAWQQPEPEPEVEVDPNASQMGISDTLGGGGNAIGQFLAGLGGR